MKLTTHGRRQILPCAAGFAAALFSLFAADGAYAQSTPEFFFATPGATPTGYTQGLTSQSVAANGTVTLSVWYQFQSSTTFFGMDVFVGFDQTTTYGSGATPQSNTVTLPSGQNATSAVTNVNPILIDLSNTLGGGQDPSSATSPATAPRPYGDDIFLDSASIAGFSAPGSTPVHIFDITLHNAALGAGGSQQIAIYSSDPNGSGADFTTYLDNGSGAPDTFSRPASSYLLSLFQPGSFGALPEPNSLALAALAGSCLGGVRLRRRRSGRITRRA